MLLKYGDKTTVQLKEIVTEGILPGLPRWSGGNQKKAESMTPLVWLCLQSGIWLRSH